MVSRRKLLRWSSVLCIISCGLLGGSTAVADEIVLADSSRVIGFIVLGTADSVQINTGLGPRWIAHKDIATVRFAAADVIRMKAGQQQEAKILAKEGESVVVLRPEGLDRLPNSYIKNVWYNRGHALEAHVMAATDRAFKNEATAWPVAVGETRQRIALGLRTGYHFAALKDWKDQFVFVDDNKPLGQFLLFGADIHYLPIPSFYVGGGVEYMFGQKVEIIGTGQEDRLSGWLYFGTVGFGITPKSEPDISIGGALDVGYLSAKETLKQGGYSVDGTAGTVAFRPKLRAMFAVERNLLLSTDIGVLIAKAKDVKVLHYTVSGYDLDFTGLTIAVGIAYLGWL